MRARNLLPLLAATAMLLAAPPARANGDPLESVNRRVHGFNQVVRGWVLDPAAAAWMATTTPGFRAGVANALGNLGEPVSAAASLAAGEFRLAANAVVRFGVNTTVGLGGVRDRAADWGYQRRPFALADALCSWGVPSGPFLVLPVLGPSTLRDAGATFATHAALSNTFGSEAVFSWRASDLFVGYAPFAEEVRRIDAEALDSYAVHRSAYLQRRAFACPTDRMEEVAEED
ncbi:MlaA family lipoprotein [Neoroseomonas rubea]|uniref:MlaA family lipoprotein n=1 Tax=Neoroseomonas rubea TaxID=2748666 RepID=UPI0018DFE4F7|nr:MlaA family lipoprotein [Roseomonas rubea]